VSQEWPSEVELTLDGIAQGGEGVGRWQDRVIFVRGGLPGERVRVRVVEEHPKYARAALIAIDQESPERVSPRNPAADHMGWQHVAWPAQLRYKQQILSDQLAKIGGLSDVVVEPTRPTGPAWGYRTTARLHSDGYVVGYHQADSQEIRAASEDPLLHPTLNALLGSLPGALAVEPEVGAIEFVLRASETYGYGMASVLSTDDRRVEALRWRASCPALAGVTLGPRGKVVVGAHQLVEELCGLTFVLHPSTFFQVNLRAAETLIGLVEEGLALQGGERIVDLFCGAGVFALPLARRAGSVIGIEAVSRSVEDAIESAELNGIEGVEFWAGQVEQALAEIEGQVDAVVLDPPRRGCHPAALAELLRIRPARIVYVSCQPATLARDLRTLTGGGYRLTRATPVDCFPQTPHIESVCVLERA
jgi:23S rRNA (uracil1939-C5)-methyltransferase